MALTIIGGGLAGLLAAHAWPQAVVLESGGRKSEHKALLRFRSEEVSKLSGIDFRRVTVRKGIWFGGKFVSPSIGMANHYACKVTGSLSGDRSIWSLEPVERWIAPEDFYEQLVRNVGTRIAWETPFHFATARDRAPVINTAPLPIVCEQLGVRTDSTLHGAGFARSPIKVRRYRVAGADVFQTVYFPEPAMGIYRASITGSLLIVEAVRSRGSLGDFRAVELEQVLQAFGLEWPDTKELDEVEQKYGKIVPLPDQERKALLHVLTQDHGVFSLGRFATWRNILLDDVVQDIAVLRKLLRATDYERRLHAS